MGKNREEFLEAFRHATAATNDPLSRTFNSCVLFNVNLNGPLGLRLRDCEVHLDLVRATPMGNGHGTKAMTFLTQLADRYEIDIILQAAPPDAQDDDAPTVSKLISFYNGFGFKICGPENMMIRFADHMAFPEPL
jgi:hypothetical protein